MMTREDFRAAINTDERKLWLDPEDLESMVDDLVEAQAADLRRAVDGINRSNKSPRTGYVGS